MGVKRLDTHKIKGTASWNFSFDAMPNMHELKLCRILALFSGREF